jgi:hypothetical protein
MPALFVLLLWKSRFQVTACEQTILGIGGQLKSIPQYLGLQITKFIGQTGSSLGKLYMVGREGPGGTGESRRLTMDWSWDIAPGPTMSALSLMLQRCELVCLSRQLLGTRCQVGI